MPTLAELAAGLGLPVFPCGPDKRPLLAGGCRAPRTDPETIQAEFQGTNAPMIGMATGLSSWTVVIDVDPRHGGMDWYNAVAPKLADTPTRMVRTPSGGLHIYFEMLTEHNPIRNSQSKIAPGVDVRGEGGYVIVPPTPGYEVLVDSPIALMPHWLVELCLPPSVPAPAPTVRLEPAQPLRNGYHKGGEKYGLEGLYRECAKVRAAPFGEQEETLNSAGLSIGGLIAGGFVDESFAAAELLAAARAMPSEPGREPWRANHVEQKVRRAIADGMRNPRVKRELPPPVRRIKGHRTEPFSSEAATEGQNSAENCQSATADLRQILSAPHWVAREFPVEACLMGDIITETSRVFLVGQTGLGKTMLGLAMATAMSLGEPFLNWPCDQVSCVLYIDGEMSAQVIQQRIKEAERRAKKTIDNLFTFAADDAEIIAEQFPDFPPFAPLNTEEGQTFVWALVELVKPQVIVFDNVMCLVQGDQKDEVPWADAVPLVKALTKRRIAQLWLDHTGHNTGRQYGSSTKAWIMDAVGIMSSLPEADRVPGQLAFQLSFDFPGKARRRNLDNWKQFAPQTIRLVDDEWTTDDVKAKPPVAKRVGGQSGRALELLQNLILEKGQLGHPGVPPGFRSVTEADWKYTFLESAMPGSSEKSKSVTFRNVADMLEAAHRVGYSGKRVWLCHPEQEHRSYANDEES